MDSASRLQWYSGFLTPHLDEAFNLQSRLHRLDAPDCASEIWVLREDELGGWLGGTKWRKYASLLPFLKREGIACVILVGGAHSNHVASLVPLLRQFGIEVKALLRGEPEGPLLGNRLLIETSLGPKNIRWVPRSDWDIVIALADEWKGELEKQGRKCLVLPEGGAHTACAAGALTLAPHICGLANNNPFDRVWIDAGTGYVASALCYGLAALGSGSQVHTVLMAGGKPKFQVNFETYCEHHFAALVPGVEVPLPQVYHPLFLPQFGKVNPALFSYIVQAQRQWGLWLDPVYSAKLFQTALTVEQSFYAGGRTLLIHSGGQSSLMGFTAELMAQCGGKKIR